MFINYKILTMKRFLCIFIIISFAALLASCDPGRPSETEMKNYLTALSYYYPYSVTDTFVFVNDSSGKTWVAYPYRLYGDSIYPRTELTKLSGKTTGWVASIEANMVAKDMNFRNEGIRTYISYMGGILDMHWDVELMMNEDESAHGGYILTCAKDELLSNLTDTLLIPIPSQVLPGPPVVSPDGAYARIVKNQGLTDFSTDGKSVWRRVR